MISIIVPTFNERDNIGELISRISAAFERENRGDFEILVMDDDSPDGTLKAAEEKNNSRVRLFNRRGNPRGLSASVIDGFSNARGEMVGVIDADLSHPPELLPDLMRAVEKGATIAVGSRYVPGGGVENWPWKRRAVSRVACFLARPVTSVRDATSGFFVMKKEALSGRMLNPSGFKIGLEVFVKCARKGAIVEVPYIFRDRKKGQSKFGPEIIRCYLKQLFSLMRATSSKV